MSEQERTQPGNVESQTEVQYTQDDLKIKIEELSRIEKMLFNSDGIVDGNSDDTIIDKEFKEGLKQAQDIQTKIKLVERLIDYYSVNYIYFDSYKETEYLDDEDKKNIELIQKETQKLLNKYPKYKDAIISYVGTEFKRIEFIVNYYKKEYEKTKDLEHLSVIKTVLKRSYDIFLNGDNNDGIFTKSGLQYLKEYLDYVENSKDIKDKPRFLDYFIKNTKIYGMGGDNLGIKKVGEIYKLKFFTDSSYSDESMEEKNACNLLKIKLKDLQFIDKLYSDGKEKELVDFIDNLDNLEYKNDLLSISSIEGIYIESKKKEFGLKDYIDNIKYIGKIIINLSNIKNHKIKNDYVEFLKKYNDFSKDEKKEFYNNLFNELNKKIDNLSKYDLYDINYELDILYDLTFYEIEKIKYDHKYDHKNELSEQNIDKLSEISTKLKENIKKIIEEKIEQLKTQGLNNEEIFKIISRFEIIKKNKDNQDKSDHKSDQIKNLLSFYDYISKSGQNKNQYQEKTENKDQIEEIKSKMQKLGLNVKLTDDGKIVGKNGETNFKQTIGNRTFEIRNDGKIIIQGAFGYEFRYENNIEGIERYLEIAPNIEFIDNLGLGYFGNNLKNMINILNIYSSYTGLKQINIDDKSINSTNFIDQIELTNLTKAFYKIGFFETDNFDYSFQVEKMTDEKFNEILKTKFKNNNFYSFGSFNPDLFKKIILETNWN